MAIGTTIAGISGLALAGIGMALGWEGGGAIGKLIKNIDPSNSWEGPFKKREETADDGKFHVEATEQPTKENIENVLNNINQLGAAQGGKEEEKTPIPPTMGNLGGIQDTTNESVGENINTPSVSWQEWALQMRNEQWAREDQIRAEKEKREDTAIQRRVEDMRKAGVNPNLVGISPAESNGGITNATGIDTSTITSDMNNNIEMLQQLIDNNFKGNENDKDRLIQSIGDLMQLAGMAAIAFGRKK